MTRQHCVEPSNAPGTAGRAAELVAFFTHCIGKPAADFGGKWSTADPRCVSLADAKHPVQAARGNTSAAEQRASSAIRRAHERISPVIDVEHHTVGALEQNAFTSGDCF